MVQSTLLMPRIEGGARLTRSDDGRLRIRGDQGRNFEQRLLKKAPLDAPQLTQQISADSGLAHGITALTALEAAAGVEPAPMGRTLRNLMLNLSILHAHLRQIYQQSLPDYLPYATLGEYKGAHPKLHALAASVSGRGKNNWAQARFPHPFTAGEVGRLWERRLAFEGALYHLQRMMALLGGKYPIVMNLVPGGVSMAPQRQHLLRLGQLLAEVRGFIEGGVLEDARLLIHRYPHIAELGKGGEDFLVASAGETETDSPQRWAIPGIFIEQKLDTFGPLATESISHSFYRIQREGAQGAVVAPTPDKPEAYSWIKAPRFQGRPMETGPMARMLIAYLSGTRQWSPDLVDEVERTTRKPLQQSNTVAGRILARAGELVGLSEHVERQLNEIDPDVSVMAPHLPDLSHFNGEGLGSHEGPAGAIQHRVIVEGGRISHYDIISSDAWNGAPRDQTGLSGSLEMALNAEKLDFSSQRNRLDLSRIVHAFAFSMSDAVH